MGGPLDHQVLGQLTLGQQGVGADVLVFDVNGVEQRKRWRALGVRLLAHSAMALYPRMPHKIAPAAMASTAGSGWRRPWRRRGSGMSAKKSGKVRIWSAVSMILGAPIR